MTSCRSTRCFLVLAALVAACGGGGASQGRETTPTDAAEAPAWATGHDDVLTAAMSTIASRLEAEGIAPGAIYHRGFLATRARETVPIDVPAHRCLSLITLASTGVRDIDAVLYGPSGDLLAEDVEPDPHPTIQICGGEAGRHVYLHLYVYEGAGAFLFVGFESDDDTSFATIARIVGGQPGVAANAGPAAEASSRVTDFTQGAARRGYRPDGAPLPVHLDADQRVRVPLATRRGRCYSVAAFAGPGLRDVDLTVYDEAGVERARDRAETADAAAQLCVARDSNLSVELHAAGGEGEAEFHILSAPDSAAGGPNGLWLGERSDERRASSSLQQTLERRDQEARAEGWGAARAVASGELLQAEAIRHAIRLPAGRCSRIEVSGGHGLSGFRLRLSSASGEVAARRTTVDDSGISLCPEAAFVGQLQLSALGRGRYAVRRFERILPAGLSDVSPWARGRLVDVKATLRRQAFEELSVVERPAGGAEELAIEAPAEGCVQVHAVSGSAAKRVVLEVTRGERVASRSVGLVTRALVCAREGAEAARVTLRGQGGTTSWVVLSRPVTRRR